MKKLIVGYCNNCHETTKQHQIQCEDSLAWRAFETIVTVGFALTFPRNYYCECDKCGEVNVLSK